MNAKIYDLSVNLKAENSSGTQELIFQYYNYDSGDKFFYATLCGTHNHKPIQIDFDEMSKNEVDEMILTLQLISDEMEVSHE